MTFEAISLFLAKLGKSVLDFLDWCMDNPKRALELFVMTALAVALIYAYRAGYSAGDKAGTTAVQVQWDAQKAADAKAVAVAQAAAQSDAQKAFYTLDAKLKKRSSSTQQSMEKLREALAKSNRACHAGPDSVRLYNQITGSESADSGGTGEVVRDAGGGGGRHTGKLGHSGGG